MALNRNTCPKVLFTGLCVNYKKELSLAFGDYAEVYHGTDNTAKSRSISCIALYPCNNSTGSWVFLNLQTKRQVLLAVAEDGHDQAGHRANECL
jgi:hypothetical protein